MKVAIPQFLTAFLVRLFGFVCVALLSSAVFLISPLPTPLCAQVRPAAAGAVKEKVPLVSVTFSYLSLDEDIEDVRYDNGGRANTIKFVPKSFKPFALPYSGPEVLEFYREKTDAEGKPVRSVIASAKIPASSGNFLVLFKSIGGERFGTLVLPDTLTPTSANSWRVVNLTRRYIAFQMKDFRKQEVIAPMQSAVLDLGATEGYSEVATYLPDANNPKRWALAHSGRRFHSPGRPCLLIYSDDLANPAHLNVVRIESAIKSPSSASGNSGTSGRGAKPAPRRR